MTLFDFTFGLSAVVLGLALTQLASNFHRLAIAGRRVRWAPEPVLLSGIIFLVIVSVWLTQWPSRGMTHTTIGLMLIQVTKLLMPYLAAAFVLPDVLEGDGQIDLYRHYDRTRPFTYGVLITGLILFWLHVVILEFRAGERQWSDWPAILMDGPWPFVAVYLLLIFVRLRWFNILLLTGGLLFYGWQIAGIPLQS